MTDWRYTAKTQPYLDALTATESIEEPAVGFVKPTEQKSNITAAIKQNNTILQLLVKISEDLSDCKDAIKDIKRVVAEKSAGTSADIPKTIEELEKSLKKLSLGEPIKRKPKPAAPFYVFKDPKKIFEEEKKKAIQK